MAISEYSETVLLSIKIFLIAEFITFSIVSLRIQLILNCFQNITGFLNKTCMESVIPLITRFLCPVSLLAA